MVILLYFTSDVLTNICFFVVSHHFASAMVVTALQKRAQNVK